MKGVLICHSRVKKDPPTIFPIKKENWVYFILDEEGISDPDLFNPEVVRQQGLGTFDVIMVQFDYTTYDFDLAIDLLRVGQELLRYGGNFYFDTLPALISNNFAKLNNEVHQTSLTADDLIDEYMRKSTEAKLIFETYLRDIRNRTKYYSMSILTTTDLGRYRNGEYEPVIVFTK